MRTACRNDFYTWFSMLTACRYGAHIKAMPSPRKFLILRRHEVQIDAVRLPIFCHRCHQSRHRSATGIHRRSSALDSHATCPPRHYSARPHLPLPSSPLPRAPPKAPHPPLRTGTEQCWLSLRLKKMLTCGAHTTVSIQGLVENLLCNN